MKINLVLSGGGARGIAHLGVMKSMLEHGLVFRAISGTSAGAWAGAFLAAGLSPDEALEVAVENSDFRWRRLPFTMGFLSRGNMERVLRKYFPGDSFSALSIPLYVAVTNINNATTDYFSSGEIIRPLLASAALPLLFQAVEINGSQYLDGGLLNNLPVEPFLEDSLPLVGVFVNPLGTHAHYRSSLRIVERSMELAIYRNITSRKEKCRLFLEPEGLVAYSVYDFSSAREIFNTGYEYAAPELDKFLEREAKGEKP